MSLFKLFPKTLVSPTNDQNLIEFTDYFRYVDVNDKLSKGAFAYKTIDILNGERPDILSYRLYGTPNYYWTFFITNDHLKDGLSRWPKSDSELEDYIAESYKNLSAFRFPYTKLRSGTHTPVGLPINNENYLPYLYLSYFISNYQNNPENPIYATAKIRSFDSDLSMVWIDSSTFSWYAPNDDTLNDLVGGGGLLDAFYQKKANTIMYHDTNYTYGDDRFSIQFIHDGTTSSINNRARYIEDLKKVWDRVRPETAPVYLDGDIYDENQLDRYYNFYNSQYWKDGSLAPAYFTDSDGVVSEYSVDRYYTSYATNTEEIKEDNDSLKRIVYVSPEYIRDFANEYRRLINE